MESIEQLQKTYASMTDDELEAVASDAYDLTDTAQEALRAELSRRGSSVELKGSPPKPAIKNPELDLALVTTVWSLEEADKVKAVLNAAGIHSYFGREYTEDVDSLQESFDDGVDVRVSCYAQDMAGLAIADVQKNDPQEFDDPEDDDDVEEDISKYEAQFVHCPKCQSEDVDLDHDIDAESLKYDWHCNDCGHKWKDENIEE